MFKGYHFDRSVFLLCVRWYLSYNLCLRDLKEMMAERGLKVDHSTVHRWGVHFAPRLLERFNRAKRAITGNLPAAKRFLRRALQRHNRPDRIVIDGSQTNHEAIISCNPENRLQNRSRRTSKPIRIHKSKYLNNRIEQDYRRIKRRTRSMLGFKSTMSAEFILFGIEMGHMMRKRQARFAYNLRPSIAEQFEILAI